MQTKRIENLIIHPCPRHGDYSSLLPHMNIFTFNLNFSKLVALPYTRGVKKSKKMTYTLFSNATKKTVINEIIKFNSFCHLFVQILLSIILLQSKNSKEWIVYL